MLAQNKMGRPMSEIIMMYADGDRPAADAVAKLLQKQGLEISLRGGRDRKRGDAEAFDNAACVVSLWSKRACKDAGFIALSRLAARRDVLVSASLDGYEPPKEVGCAAAIALDRPGQDPDALSTTLADAIRKPAGHGQTNRVAPNGMPANLPSNLAKAARVEMSRRGRAVAQGGDSAQEDYLRSFVRFCGLEFGSTLDDAISLFGLPNASNESAVSYVFNDRDGPGIIAIHAFDESTKLIGFILAYGTGSAGFLAEHKVSDPRLSFIGKHRDEIFRTLGAPSISLGAMDDGTIAFGYDAKMIIQATAPDGETARFGLMIGIVFLLTSRDAPFCCGLSVQWIPVHLSDLES